MSRKHELLNLMNIDTSWIKNIRNDTINLSNFNSLELEAKNCHACSLSNTRNNVVFGKGSQKAKERPKTASEKGFRAPHAPKIEAKTPPRGPQKARKTAPN